jgi:hypothetical protein
MLTFPAGRDQMNKDQEEKKMSPQDALKMMKEGGISSGGQVLLPEIYG